MATFDRKQALYCVKIELPRLLIFPILLFIGKGENVETEWRKLLTGSENVELKNLGTLLYELKC